MVETEGGTGPSFNVQVYTAAPTVKITELTTTPPTTTRQGENVLILMSSLIKFSVYIIIFTTCHLFQL